MCLSIKALYVGLSKGGVFSRCVCPSREGVFAKLRKSFAQSVNTSFTAVIGFDDNEFLFGMLAAVGAVP